MAETTKDQETTKATKKKAALVEYELPLTYDPEIDDYPETVSLNFKTYAIKRGERVKIPAAVKKILEDREAARNKAYRYSQQKSLSTKEKEFEQRYGLTD